MADMKKEFQKVIAKIRKEMGVQDYPKAMCTNQQMEKNTATVNCGYYDDTDYIVKTVMNHAEFKEFLSQHNATAHVEEHPNLSGKIYNQIRINFGAEKEEEKGMKKAVGQKTMFTLDGVGYNQNAKGNRFFKVDKDGKLVRISRAEYEIAYETYMDNAEQEMYDEEQELREKKSRESDKIAEDSVNRPKRSKRTRAATSVVDLGKIKVALTEKQIAFMMALPLSKHWKNTESAIYIMDLGMDLGGEFAEKPMTVGAMITTLREKGVIFVTQASRKERYFTLTEIGQQVAKKMGVK